MLLYVVCRVRFYVASFMLEKIFYFSQHRNVYTFFIVIFFRYLSRNERTLNRSLKHLIFLRSDWICRSNDYNIYAVFEKILIETYIVYLFC